MKFTDQNGQYNFEGFTSLEDFVAAELVKYPHTVGLSFYHEAGVFTIEDKIKWDIYGMISDASKELNGCRARFDFLQSSVEELYADYERYVQWIEDDANYEQNREAELIQGLIDHGAPDEETAKRWAQEWEGAYDIDAELEEQNNLWSAQMQAIDDEYYAYLEEVA